MALVVAAAARCTRVFYLTTFKMFKLAHINAMILHTCMCKLCRYALETTIWCVLVTFYTWRILIVGLYVQVIYYQSCLVSVVVGRRTSDREVASSVPGRCIAG